LPIYIQDLGGTAQQEGWVMGSFAIGLLLFCGALGYLCDRHSKKK
jgi:MFS family permease